MRNIKIKTRDMQHYKRVMLVLRLMGYAFRDHHDLMVQNPPFPFYLYGYSDGTLKHNNDKEWFTKHENKEIEID